MSSPLDLKDTHADIFQVVEEYEDAARTEVANVEAAGLDATETKLRVTIMRVLTPLLAIGDIIKNGVAVGESGFTVTGAVDGTADLLLVGNQVRRYAATGDLVGYGFLYQLVALVQVLESLNGIGRPDTGQSFASGASGFDAVKSFLGSADPDPSRWSGPAAQAYAVLNADQKSLAARVAELDCAIAVLVQNQADDIEKVRIGLTSVKATLVALAIIMPGLIAATRSPATKLLAIKIVAGIMIPGLTAALGLMVFAVLAGQSGAKSAQGTIAAYAEVAAAAAALSKPSGQPPMPAKSAAPASAAAPVGSSAAPASAPAPASSAATGAAVSAAPTFAADPTPAPAATTMPTLGQIAQTVGIATQLEAGLAQASTQGMQSVQQFASMAAQAGRRAPAAPAGPSIAGAVQKADKDAADHEVPPEGATSGEAGTGRAPVDAGGPAPATEQQFKLA